MTKNLTRGNPIKLIIFFALPLLIGNLCQQFYVMADTLIVGRTMGVDALAAVGCTGSVSFLILGFTFGLTGGLAIPTAQRFGAGDMAGVRRSVAHGGALAALIGVGLTIIAVPLTRPMLQMLRTPAEIIDQATQFLSVIFLGMCATVLFNFLCATIRALGDSRTPLVFLAITCVLNVALDFLLIPRMGVAGAATATVTSQFASAVMCLVFIAKKMPILRLKREDWRLTGSEFAEQARIGLPMGFQSSIIAIGSISLQFALNGLGTTAVAAYTAAARIDGIAMAPLQTFGVTMATYCAQNFGAGKFRRIRVGVRQASLLAVGTAVAIGALNIFAGHIMIDAFVADSAPEVVRLAQIFLTVNGLCYSVLALLFVLRSALQGLGHTLVPTIAGVGELVMRVAGALVLAGMLGFLGVCLSNPLAWLGAFVPLAIAWTRQRKALEVLEAEEEANAAKVPGEEEIASPESVPVGLLASDAAARLRDENLAKRVVGIELPKELATEAERVLVLA